MKKAIVLLLALAVLGGAVFAQATVNGYVRAKADFSDAGSAFATRVRLNISYTTEDKNAYAFVRLQSSDYNAPSVSYAYARVNLFDGMAKLTGGKLANYDYNLGSGVSEYLLGNVSNDGYALDAAKGMLLQVMPVEALSIGVAYLPTVGTAVTLSDFGFNVKYDIASVGSVIVESTMASTVADSRYSASFSFTGVEGLTASAGYKSAMSKGSIYGIFDYTMSGITFEVAPEYNLDTSGIYVEGYASTAINDTLSLNVLGAYDTDVVNLDGTYLFGLELLYKISAKGLIQTGLTYADVTGIAVPLVVKVSF